MGHGPNGREQNARLRQHFFTSNCHLASPHPIQGLSGRLKRCLPFQDHGIEGPVPVFVASQAPADLK
jgi:hypothetical protein